jgi:uncharacterized protein Usg
MKRRVRGRALELQLKGYRLATAEIIYRMPDHQHLLQSYIWQQYDLAPDFPELRRFLDFWVENLDGPLHSVRVMQAGLIQPCEFNAVEHSYALH